MIFFLIPLNAHQLPMYTQTMLNYCPITITMTRFSNLVRYLDLELHVSLTSNWPQFPLQHLTTSTDHLHLGQKLQSKKQKLCYNCRYWHIVNRSRIICKLVILKQTKLVPSYFKTVLTVYKKLLINLFYLFLTFVICVETF